MLICTPVRKSPEKLAHAFEAFLIEELLSRTENTFMDNVAAQFFGKAAKEASPLTIYNLLNTSLFAGADLERCWDTSDPEHPKLTRAGALHILISRIGKGRGPCQVPDLFTIVNHNTRAPPLSRSDSIL